MEERKLSKTELEMLSIWQGVLKKEKVDIKKSFFAQGGKSIDVTTLVKMVEEKFPGMVKVSDFFQYYSIEKMSAYIDSQKDAEVEKEESAKEVQGREDYSKEMGTIIDSMENGELSVEDALSKLLD